MDANRLLIVDDERPVAELVGRIAREADFDVRITEDPADFLVVLDRWQPSLVIVDLQMPGMRSEEHTSELQSLMRSSYAVFCLKKKNPEHRHRPVQKKQSQHSTKQHNLEYTHTPTE